MTDLEEFQEIRIILIRDPDYLNIARRFGHSLQPDCHILTLKLPFGFTRMEEKNIDKLKEHLKAELAKTELELEEG
jgi:hypothetical protein